MSKESDALKAYGICGVTIIQFMSLLAVGGILATLLYQFFMA